MQEIVKKGYDAMKSSVVKEYEKNPRIWVSNKANTIDDSVFSLLQASQLISTEILVHIKRFWL